MTDETPHQEATPRRRLADGGRYPRNEERPPTADGRFYAGSEADLRRQIADCFAHEIGPGPLEEATAEAAGGAVAIVSPHAGYPFSGPVAAHGFAELAAGDAPETVVVFGPNHEGFGAEVAVAPHERFRTPLGPVPIDEHLVEAVVEESADATFDERAHAGEHSIEVQLPFLQYCLDDVAVVPICTSRLGGERAERLGRDVAAAIETTGRETAIVSSTDLTHYEDHETAAAADEDVLEAIEAFDLEGLAELVGKGHSMCGPWATVAGLAAALELGAADAEILRYATSGDTGGSKNRVVGYCSAVVR